MAHTGDLDDSHTRELTLFWLGLCVLGAARCAYDEGQQERLEVCVSDDVGTCIIRFLRLVKKQLPFILSTGELNGKHEGHWLGQRVSEKSRRTELELDSLLGQAVGHSHDARIRDENVQTAGFTLLLLKNLSRSLLDAIQISQVKLQNGYTGRRLSTKVLLELV